MYKKKKKLKIASWNVGRKVNAVDAMNIKQYMKDKDLDILLLQETAHAEEDVGKLVRLFQGKYSYWSNDPYKKGLGQGVGIITNENIIGKTIKMVPGYLFGIEIRGKKSCQIFNLYHSKTSIKYNERIDIIQKKIKEEIGKINSRSILGGDFNENLNGRLIQYMLNKEWKAEYKHGKDYTYISGDHKTFIDHFLSLETNTYNG